MPDDLAPKSPDDVAQSAPEDPAPSIYERALDEHRAAVDHVHQYREMRFKQLTLFTVLTAALMGARKDLGALAPILGLTMTVAFYALELRCTTYRRRYARRVRELEDGPLQFRQFSYGKLPGWWSSIVPITVLFAVILVAWAFLLIGA